jgi:uncharacterized protein (TIGR03083 family)
MTDPMSWVAPIYRGLADLLADGPADRWDAPSLCEGWRVREVVAHVTMPARLTPDRFGAEMAAAGGDFTVLSNTVAIRDAALPIEEHLAALRSPVLHAWQPPGGGAQGALSHAAIHALDVTVALALPPQPPAGALRVLLDALAGPPDIQIFGLDLAGLALTAPDLGWTHGTGTEVSAPADHLVALLAGRTLPDGRTLRR